MLSQQWAISVMKLQEAWDITTGDTTVVIGDVDSGVDWTHPDLSASIYVNKGEWGVSGELRANGIDDDGNGKIDDWHGWDFIGTGSAQAPIPDNDPMDGAIGHGTNTSGCAAATANNGIGIAGTGYRVKILPIKAAGETSAGIAAGYEGIKYAADMGCRVINCSWGSTGVYSQTLQDIVNYAFNKGALIVASSGNNPLDNDRVPHWPSSYTHILNVGSIESNGAVSSWCTYGTSVHVYAPGSSVLTTRKGGGYTNQTGTSFSSPLTAGVAALVFSVHPTWTPDQVAKQIRVTADPFTTPPQAKRYGRVNAFRAVSTNQNLSDIPGIHLRNFLVTTSSGSMFTQPGQTARVEFILENVLAPTSESAVATLQIEDTSVSITSGTTFPLGVIPTFGTKSIIVDLKLSDNPLISEGYIPLHLMITDGAYTDYVVGRIAIYLQTGWHTALSISIPTFYSLDIANPTAVWGTVIVMQNQTPAQEYCFRYDGGQWYSANGSGYPSLQGAFCITARDGSTAFVGTGPSSGAATICRTTNGGQSWSSASVSSITPFVDAIHMFSATEGIFIGDPLSGRWGIGKTTDGGATWTAVTPYVSAASGEAGWNNSCQFIGDIGWFGTNNGKIYKTTDRGATWRSYPTPSRHSVDISFRDQFVGAIRFSVQNNTGTNALAVTTDGGETWSLVNTIQMTPYGSIIMEPNGKRLWLLRDGNSYVSSNLGQTWRVEPRPSGFDPITVTDAYVDRTDTYVYAAGFDVYRFISPFESVATDLKSTPAEANGLFISGIYPNPVLSGQAVVEFHVCRPLPTELVITDLNGRVVRKVFSAILETGTHSAWVDLSGLSAGVYHVQLTSEGMRSVVPLSVVR
ncbi:MAG: S8 family serine peptidase [Bacteroidota bacterium]|nr:S8 family serine peptidase [Bacteroidota bacterium]